MTLIDSCIARLRPIPRVLASLSALHSSLIGLAFAAGVLSGCASTTSPAGTSGNTPLWITPSLGTTYIYSVVTSITDTATQTLPTSFDTEVVSGVGLQYLGKTNVFEIGNSSSRTFAAVLTNGDLLMADSSSDPVRWKQYPLSAGEIYSDPVIDSVRQADGTHIRQTDIRAALGTEQLTLLGKTYTSYHVRETATLMATNTQMMMGDTSTYVVDVWFVPAIGSYGREVLSYTDRNGDPSGSTVSGFTSDIRLTAYQPK